MKSKSITKGGESEKLSIWGEGEAVNLPIHLLRSPTFFRSSALVPLLMRERVISVWFHHTAACCCRRRRMAHSDSEEGRPQQITSDYQQQTTRGGISYITILSYNTTLLSAWSASASSFPTLFVRLLFAGAVCCWILVWRGRVYLVVAKVVAVCLVSALNCCWSDRLWYKGRLESLNGMWLGKNMSSVEQT